MKVYRGKRTENGAVVTVDNRPLDPRLDLRYHSPDGFEWGYAGSGPAQLSLALLADVFNDEVALAYYQIYKARWTQLVQAAEWEVTEDEIRGYFA